MHQQPDFKNSEYERDHKQFWRNAIENLAKYPSRLSIHRIQLNGHKFKINIEPGDNHHQKPTVMKHGDKNNNINYEKTFTALIEMVSPSLIGASVASGTLETLPDKIETAMQERIKTKHQAGNEK